MHLFAKRVKPPASKAVTAAAATSPFPSPLYIIASRAASSSSTTTSPSSCPKSPYVRKSSTIAAQQQQQQHGQRQHQQQPVVPGKESLYPLSALPTGNLLRSLLISGVSSRRALLVPALSALSFLSSRAPGGRRSLLLDVDRNPLLRGLLRKTFYDQFCAGTTRAEARSCVRDLRALGFEGVIITYARETTFDHKAGTNSGGVDKGAELASEEQKRAASFDEELEAWRAGTLATLDLVGEGDILALKLSGAGPGVVADLSAGRGPSKQFADALEEICARSKERSVQVIVDAESQEIQGGIGRLTLDLMRRFNNNTRGGGGGGGPAVVYNTYQAYLKGTPAVLAEHLAAAEREGFTLGLKLVRGAYMLTDDRALIHDTKRETDAAYDSIAQGALQQRLGAFGGGGQDEKRFPSVNLLLASHNRDSVLAANRMHQERTAAGLPTVPVSFAQLHGMSDAVSFKLLQDRDARGRAPRVYKCTTWGSMSECIAYLGRRAKENQDAVLRTTDEYAALKGEAWRRLTRVFRA